MRVHRRVCNTGFNVYALEGLSRCSFRWEYIHSFHPLPFFLLSSSFFFFFTFSLFFLFLFFVPQWGRNPFLLLVCSRRFASQVNDIGIMLNVEPLRPSSVNDRFPLFRSFPIRSNFIPLLFLNRRGRVIVELFFSFLSFFFLLRRSDNHLYLLFGRTDVGVRLRSITFNNRVIIRDSDTVI